MRRILATLCFMFVLGTFATSVHSQDDGRANQIGSEDAVNVRPRTLLIQHNADIVEMGFSPNGSAFVTGGLDRQFCVWNIADQRGLAGSLLFCDTDYTPGVTVHAWSADEKRLAVLGATGTTIRMHRVYQVFDTSDWEDAIYLTINHPEDAPILSLHMVDGALLVYDIYDTFTLYDWTTGDAIATYDGLDALPHPNGQTIALITFDGDVDLIDVHSGDVIETLATENTRRLLFSPDGNTLATVGDDVYLWDITTAPAERARIAVREAVNVQFTPDSQQFVTWEPNVIRIWALDGGAAVGIILEVTDGVRFVEFTPDMTRAITVDNAGRARIWDINDGFQIERRLLIRDRVDRVYLAPDSQTLLIARVEFFSRFYDIQRGQLRGRYEMLPDSEISPDWTIFATRSNNIVTWHTLASNETVFALEPISYLPTAINVRQTPSTEQARIAVVDALDPIFALSRTEDSQWLYIVLPDGTRGYTFISGAFQLNRPVDSLPVVEAP